MPTIDNRIIEALRRQQLVTEYIIYPFSDVKNYQVKLANVPSSSKEDVLVILNKKILPHWVETKGNVWTKIPELKKNTPISVYVLTGNPSAASVSNGTNTFIQYKGASNTNYLLTVQNQITDIIVESVGRSDASENLFIGIGDASSASIPNGLEHLIAVGVNAYIVNRKASAQTFLYTNGFLTASTYYRMTIKRHDAQVDYYYNDVLFQTPLTTNIPIVNLGLFAYKVSGTWDTKFSFIRKYIPIEPIINKVKTLNKSLLLKELMR